MDMCFLFNVTGHLVYGFFYNKEAKTEYTLVISKISVPAIPMGSLVLLQELSTHCHTSHDKSPIINLCIIDDFQFQN
jgi:hypothetical protein